MSYLPKKERSAYIERCRDNIESQLLIALPKTQWTPLGDLRVASKSKLHCRCDCGGEHYVRVSDIIYGGSLRCRSCADKLCNGNKLQPIEELLRRLELANRANERLNVENWGSYRDIFGVDEVKSVYSTMNGAASRCNNIGGMSYKNYGGRGIEFKFPNPTEATKWVLNNLGVRPTKTHSIDRIDNNRHYEPGNLRWATRSEQAQNKRQYLRIETGEKIRLIMSQRNDVTYECVRTWLKQGLSVEQILNTRKWDRHEK